MGFRGVLPPIEDTARDTRDCAEYGLVAFCTCPADIPLRCTAVDGREPGRLLGTPVLTPTVINGSALEEALQGLEDGKL